MTLFILPFKGLWWSLHCQETSFVLLVLFHNNLTLCCSAHSDEDTVGGSFNLTCGRCGNELTVEGVEADGSALAYCAHGATAHGESGLGGVGGGRGDAVHDVELGVIIVGYNT